MAKNELIDAHVSSQQCKRAVNALLTHATKHQEQKQETELLAGKEQHVWLQVAVKRMHPEKKLKPFKIPLKHPLVDPRTSSVCLITKDPQREYKDLLDSHGIKFINRVVGITKLKGKFKPFEARRLLLQENGLFLADERVVPLLPGLLGRKFFDTKKQPIPVCLTRKDLKGELERAISSTYMHQNQGTCMSIKIGTLSQTPAQVLANLEIALPSVVKNIHDGWENVQSLSIKTNNSTSLPIWSCELGAEDGGRWDGLVAGDESDESSSGEEDGEEAGDSDEDEAMQVDEPKEPPILSPKEKSKGTKRVAEEGEGEKPKKKARGEVSAGLSQSIPSPALQLQKAADAAPSRSDALGSIAKKKRQAPTLSRPEPAPPASAPQVDVTSPSVESQPAPAKKLKRKQLRKAEAEAAAAAAAPVPANTQGNAPESIVSPAEAGEASAPVKNRKRRKSKASAEDVDVVSAAPANADTVPAPSVSLPPTAATSSVPDPGVVTKRIKRKKGGAAASVDIVAPSLVPEPAPISILPVTPDAAEADDTHGSKKRRRAKKSGAASTAPQPEVAVDTTADLLLQKAADNTKSAESALTAEELKQKRNTGIVGEKKKEKIMKKRKGNAGAKEGLVGKQ